MEGIWRTLTEEMKVSELLTSKWPSHTQKKTCLAEEVHENWLGSFIEKVNRYHLEDHLGEML